MIRIGECCLIGPNVVMRTANHRYDDSNLFICQQGHIPADIYIEDDVWIAANVVILGGINIDRGAVKLLKAIKRIIQRKIIEPVSISAVKQIVYSDDELRKLWEYSFKPFPCFSNHFAVPVDNKEVEHRIRLLVVGETFFIKKEIKDIINKAGKCTYADIGDSDGSVRLLLKSIFDEDKLKTVGINLQKTAVDKMKNIGLEAICADAMTIYGQGISYDLVSAFETLEHLPDPIGFLKGMKLITNHRLVLSIPYIRNSRVALAYTSNKWPAKDKPTIENTHIFELSPKDWRKIFFHTGWKIDREWKLLGYAPRSLSRALLQPYWRYMSFEGFWFVVLSKDDSFSSKYVVE